MFSKILVALDSGDTCVALFESALALAQATGANLMLLSALTPEDDSSMMMPAYSGLAYYPLGVDDSIWDVYQERYQQYATQGINRLRRFSERATEAGVSTEFNQIPGSPGRVICDLAKSWQADLIMVGSHRRKGLSEMLLGSVSNYVMHHAPCSVLVIHGQAATSATETAAETVTEIATEATTETATEITA